MSGQPPQRVRRNASPATTKQGPMRATLPVALMLQSGSPPRSSDKKNGFSDSPRIEGTKITNSLSPDNRTSPEKKTSCKERGQALQASSPVSYIRRTASLDTLYQAPSHDATLNYSYCGRMLMDRATQTPEEWNEFRKTAKKSTDSLELSFLRQRLQRSSQVGRSQQRYSPIQAVDSPPSLVTPPSSSYLHQLPLTVARAAPIPIPHIPKPVRLRNSVEGLNQEIERLVLKGISSVEGEIERFQEPTPDGHRAPVARLLRATTSVNTQTPCARSPSVSPPVRGDASSRSSTGAHDRHSPAQNGFSQMCVRVTEGRKSASSPDSDATKLGTSPKINLFLAREPPDGCEKVKMVEEPRKVSTSSDLSYGFLRPSMNFVLMPSQSSAFYPLCKSTEKPPTNERLQ